VDPSQHLKKNNWSMFKNFSGYTITKRMFGRKIQFAETSDFGLSLLSAEPLLHWFEDFLKLKPYYYDFLSVQKD
jgi:hypothetical protein